MINMMTMVMSSMMMMVLLIITMMMILIKGNSNTMTIIMDMVMIAISYSQLSFLFVDSVPAAQQTTKPMWDQKCKECSQLLTKFCLLMCFTQTRP